MVTNKIYSYNWYKYGALEISDNNGYSIAFLQGEEASDLYDMLNYYSDENVIQHILSQYDL